VEPTAEESSAWICAAYTLAAGQTAKFRLFRPGGPVEAFIISQSQGNISVTAVLATNVYERRGTRWRLVLHHASHILTGESEGEG
jgi:hypothetical protein